MAFVIPGGGGGGVRSVLRIAQGLMRRGHHVHIYHRQVRGDLRDNLRQLYHKVRFRRDSGWLGSFEGTALAYRDDLAQVIQRHDVIIGVGVACVLEIADLSAGSGIKVNNCRGVEPWCEERMYRAWSLPMPRIVVGSHLARLMREAGSRDPIYVVPNGIDPRDYYLPQSEAARDGVGVVYHGADVKDPGLIVAVLNRLALRRPNLNFYVFSTFPNPGTLPRKTTFVRFPAVSAARDLYSRSRVWFLASRNEGFGNPLLEAAACGCALVSTDCGGASDIIEHQKSGLIVPVGDVDAMVTAIERLLDDEPLREQFRQRSMDLAERLTWEGAVDSFEGALKAILAQSPGKDMAGPLIAEATQPLVH